MKKPRKIGKNVKNEKIRGFFWGKCVAWKKG